MTDNDEQYAVEQEALAKRIEEGHSEDIRIQAPQEPEVNPDVYKDVEPILFRGFLTVSAEINEVPFVFKSLNHHEMELLRFMTPDGKASNRFWNLFLAYGVLMVDGVNVLLDRDRHIPRIADTFSALQPTARAAIVRSLSEINRRASNAVTLTECYVTERYSRYRWYQLHGMDMTATSVTGIAGTERLGLNWGQLVWRALNRIDDIKESHDHSWENAKFIGGCSAGKGISKVYQQDATRKQKEKEEQLERKDKLLRQVLLGEKFGSGKEEGGAQVIVARTVEELASQLERDLRGEKDWHDLVVDEHERKIRTAYVARQKQLEDMARTRETEFGGKTLFGGTDVKGLTPAEVHEHIIRRRQHESQRAASQMVWPEDHDEKFAGALDRFIGTDDPSIGRTDRDPSNAITVPAPRRGGTPFKR